EDQRQDAAEPPDQARYRVVHAELLISITEDTEDREARSYLNSMEMTAAGGRRMLRFSVAEEMRVHEVVDDRLMRRFDVLELNPHADAAVAPRDVALRVDVALRPRHPEADLDLRSRFQRAGGPDRDAAVT